jgi:ADP-ribosyl-[dinitrogen reductase] hydrolase
MNRADAAAGCLLGTAVGDALGLACEGLSRRRQHKWHASLERYALLFGRGMCSDDTDHACMVAQAVAASGGDSRRFAASLGWRLRFWLLGLPAGVGFATLRSIIKLWFFVPPAWRGVRSAGNGPAMRSGLLGVLFAEDDERLRAHVRACTSITHTDPKAHSGALAVALAARAAMKGEGAEALLGDLQAMSDDAEELVTLLKAAQASASRGESTEMFAASIGCAKAVSGYIYHSVPVALHAWMRDPRDLEAALRSAIRCGGDTDTVAAITGAVVGAAVGRAGIPPRRLAELWDWPRGAAWMEAAARNAVAAVDSGKPSGALSLSVPGLLLRNAFFLVVVLAHGFRRLAPPY